MNRSYLALVMAFAIAPLACAPTTNKEETRSKADESLVCVETRSLEVLTKATLHYFKVAKKTVFSTFNHDLDFVTAERLEEFNRYEDAQKHSFAAKSACLPVKELLEILKNTQRELLLSTDKTKAVIVKVSFKDASKTALVKFEFSKKINTETKTVENLHLKISIFGYEDEINETLLNFIKACALENTLWQNTKPFIVGGTLIGSALVAVLSIKTSIENKAAVKGVRPIFKGLASEIARQLNRHHESHPESFARHTHDKYTEPWFSHPTRVEPYFEYCEPAAHEGLWEHAGLTFAGTKLSESAHRKDAGVVATAWLPGSFTALCAGAATWEKQTAADQERLLVVPYSVLKHDVEQDEEDTLAKQLNAANWILVVVNDAAEAINLTSDTNTVSFLANVDTYVVVTTAKLADAATAKFEASCKINTASFEVTATRADGATPQETIARLTVDALFSSEDKAVVYTETVSGTTPTIKKVTVTKANVATVPSRRHKQTPVEAPRMSQLALSDTLAFARDLDAISRKENRLSGMETLVASTNEFSERLQQFLSRGVTVNGKQAPRIVIIHSWLMDLCKNADFIAATNKAQATVIVITSGETDDWEEITASTSGETITLTKSSANFVTKAEAALAGIERAIVVPVDAKTFSWKSGAERVFAPDANTQLPAFKSHAALVRIYT